MAVFGMCGRIVGSLGICRSRGGANKCPLVSLYYGLHDGQDSLGKVHGNAGGVAVVAGTGSRAGVVSIAVIVRVVNPSSGPLELFP